MAVWFWAFTEDYWVESKFGKLDQTQENNEGRTLFFHFHLWPNRLGVTPEHEEASAADSQARESWNEAIAKVMPPAVAWEQERWDIREVLRFYPPEPETDPEYPDAGGTILSFTPDPTAGPICPGASAACGGTICSGYWCNPTPTGPPPGYQDPKDPTLGD
ncbi:hypothetical protein EsH8_III_001368 [Colletotrichum jinshuiense]